RHSRWSRCSSTAWPKDECWKAASSSVMEGMFFFGVADVFGTSGEGSTSIGISGMLSCGRALGLGAGVSVADGSGGSCAWSREAQDNKAAIISNLILILTCPHFPAESQFGMKRSPGRFADSGYTVTGSKLSYP